MQKRTLSSQSMHKSSCNYVLRSHHHRKCKENENFMMAWRRTLGVENKINNWCVWLLFKGKHSIYSLIYKFHSVSFLSTNTLLFSIHGWYLSAFVLYLICIIFLLFIYNFAHLCLFLHVGYFYCLLTLHNINYFGILFWLSCEFY